MSLQRAVDGLRGFLQSAIPSSFDKTARQRIGTKVGRGEGQGMRAGVRSHIAKTRLQEEQPGKVRN